MPFPKDHPHWQRMQFKGNKVWLAVDAGQRPVEQNGKVLIKYQLDQPHEYWVHPTRVMPLGSDAAVNPAAGPKAPGRATKKRPRATVASGTVTLEACERAICIYTDGACSGNPGPAGIGAVLRYKGKCKEISRYLGVATNNIAELEAIKAALQAVKNRDLPVIVFTDSSYALGLLERGWKARENKALVQELRHLVGNFKQLKFVKVKGHAGDRDNERADQLAVESLKGLGQ